MLESFGDFSCKSFLKLLLDTSVFLLTCSLVTWKAKSTLLGMSVSLNNYSWEALYLSCGSEKVGFIFPFSPLVCYV